MPMAMTIQLINRLTGTLSGYFLRIFSPSARLLSNGCSSLYSHFILSLYESVIPLFLADEFNADALVKSCSSSSYQQTQNGDERM